MAHKDHLFSGCMPALMTPCDADGEPDWDALVATATELIECGMSAVIYAGSMGDWPLLTDEQRCEGVDILCKNKVPVIVGTGAVNTKRAVEITRRAARSGAAGLMVLPRVLSRGSSAAAQEWHFKAVLEAAPETPAVIYNSPYYGYETRADLFFALRDKHKNLAGFKEFGGADALTYAAENITSGNPDLSLMVGVDTQVFHGYVNCGARGAITGIGNALPEPVLRLAQLCREAASGNADSRAKAKELDDALSMLAKFDEGPDLVLYYKHLMVLEGHSAYAHQICSQDYLTQSQIHFLETCWSQFKAWWASWPHAEG